jgi:DNA polymerase elongation subunit (family B)
MPPRVQLEFDGRYAAMISHEPKNYALKPYQGPVILRGVAFRSSRAEPFGQRFLRTAITAFFDGDMAAVQDAYQATVFALRRRALPTRDVAARVRLTKTPSEYLATRGQRRELAYEAMIRAGRSEWTPGEHVRVYRAYGGEAGLYVHQDDDDAEPSDDRASSDARNYDVEYYVRVLRETFAARLSRALSPEDFAVLFADPEQPTLFPTPVSLVRPVLTVISSASTTFDGNS